MYVNGHRLNLSKNAPVERFYKTEKLREPTGQWFETGCPAGVQRAQLFVQGYRECNIPVRVKGGSLAQSVAFRHLILGITCA